MTGAEAPDRRGPLGDALFADRRDAAAAPVNASACSRSFA
jgi:hypothetical protein